MSMEITDKEVVDLLEKVEKIKTNLDNKTITVDDVEEEYVIFLNLLYEIEIQELENNIKRLNSDIEEYKVRIRNAIEFLKSKRNS